MVLYVRYSRRCLTLLLQAYILPPAQYVTREYNVQLLRTLVICAVFVEQF